MPNIKHVWFDFSGTIAEPDPKRHAALRYSTFARLRNTKDTPRLRREYDELYKKLNSHSNVFVQSFGLDGSFWPGEVAKISTQPGYYTLMADNIPAVLNELSDLVPVSIFSNVDTEPVLKGLGFDTRIFTNIFSSSSLRYPKPHPGGYRRIVRLSNLPANQVLYIGDLEQKDILPAQAVGMRTGIIWNESSYADYNFRNFQEILDLFKRQEP